MARSRVPQTDWAWGELSPEAYGRLDLVQYGKSARSLINYRPMELGGVTRRAGTRLIAEVKDAANPPSLQAFVFAQGEAYVLEFGGGYIRFYRQRARLESSPGVPLEIASPYAAVDTPVLKFAQSFDALYVAHNLYPPQRLERYGNLVWKLRATHQAVSGTYGRNPPPSYEYGTRPLALGTLTPGATTGLGVTFTAGIAGVFRESDVGTVDNPGREILVIDGPSNGARARITEYTDATHVKADILEPFADLTAIPEADWKITGSPLAALTPSAEGPLGAHITLTLDKPGWRLNDAPKFVRINDGLVELNDFGGTLDPLAVLGTVRRALSSATAAQASAWSLEESSWSDANGYPAAVALGHGRLWFGGSLAQPVTVWGSTAGDFLNFAAGVLDDDSIDEMLVGGQLNAIVWLAMTTDLFAGTRGEVYRIKSGSTEVISPTNVDAKPAISYGCRPEAAPLSIGPALVFPTLSGRKLREMVYDVLQDRQLAPDLLLLANHLTKPLKGRLSTVARGIRRTAYQREPIATVWTVKDDGGWDCCTYLRDQNVVAWSPLITDGEVLDVCVAPREDGTGDEVWLVVRRVVAGQIRVFIEWMDDIGLIYDRLHVDCAVTVDGIGRTTLTPGAGVNVAGATVVFQTDGASFTAEDVGRQIWQVGGPGQALITAFTATDHVTGQIAEPFSTGGATPLLPGTWGVARQDIAGLDHLEGAVVVVSGDGAPQPRQTVVGGAITADAPAIAFEVGLGYVSTLVTQRPPDQLQGQPHAVPEVLVRLHESIGLLVNGKRPNPPFNGATLFSGDRTWANLRITNDGFVTLEQRDPLPSTILFIQGLQEVSAG